MNRTSNLSLLSASLVFGGFAHADVILDIDYTTAQGYADGNLQGQSGWQGQASAQVDTAGTGVVTSIGGPYDRNVHGTGIRGGVAGVPTTTGNFEKYESIKITFK